MDYSLLLAIEERNSSFIDDRESIASIQTSGISLFDEELSYKFDSKSKFQTYHISIIDYLQPYNFNKKVERWFKATFKGAQPYEISAIDSANYSERFIKFVKQVVLQNYSDG